MRCGTTELGWRAAAALTVVYLGACSSPPPETTLAGSVADTPGLSSDALSGAIRGTQDTGGTETGPLEDVDQMGGADDGGVHPDAEGEADAVHDVIAADAQDDWDAATDGSGGPGPGDDATADDATADDATADDATADDATDGGPPDDAGEPGPECATDDDCTAEQLGITGNDCLYPACHAGHCVGGPTPAGVACSASIAGADPGCVTSFCDGGGGCKAVILGGNGCDDGDPCTKADTCGSDGACVGGAAVICEPVSPCKLAVCDKEAGGCVPFPASNGLACDDGDPCTTETACLDGTCAAAGNICACNDDSDCDDDGDLCNGVPSCVDLPGGGKGCVVDADSVFTCPPDNDFCSETACHPATGQCITTVLPGAPCNDAEACTKSDVCHSDGTCGGTPTECDDGVPCTADSCEPVSGLCLFVPSPGAPCNDGDPCTEADACVSTTCKGTPKICDDSSPCTDDACDPGRGACMTTPLSGLLCDDGSECTTDDECLEGACVGAGVDCDDDDPCTTDSCTATAGCQFELNEDPCSDGDACTGPDACDEGLCVGLAIGCDDGTDCTIDTCDPVAGCAFEPVDSACDDGKPCTADLCDPSAGCVGVADDSAACSDGDDCTSGDACSGGACVGQLLDCSDGVPCTLDACSTGGNCVHQAVSTLCDDGNPCTLGVCDVDDGCDHQALNDSPCEDGEVCTEGDLCTAGQCAPGANICDCAVDADCDDGNPCNGTFLCETGDTGLTECVQTAAPVQCDDDTAGPCVASQCQTNTGTCELVAVEDGTICPDDDPCTIGEHCNGGVCVSSEPVCDDQVDCTNDSCEPGVGCTYLPDPTSCDDGVSCTTDSCSPVSGCASAPVGSACADDHDCTSEVCDAVDGCIVTTHDTTCEDGTDCNVDVCDVGSGCVATPDDTLCDDGDDCTMDGCGVGGVCIHEIAGDGSPCDDGNLCTTSDACDAGDCKAGAPVQCESTTGCDTGQCDAASGACVFSPVQDGTACDDADACTEQTECSGGACGGGEDTGCDDGIPCTADGCDPATGCTYAPDDGACDDGNSCTVGTCEVGSGCATTGLPDFAGCDDGAGATAPDICVSQVCRGVNLRAFDVTSLPWCNSGGSLARKVSDLDGNGFIIVNYDQSGALCGSGRSRVLKLNGASAPSGITGGDTGSTLTSISHDLVVGDTGQVGQLVGSFVSYLFNDVADALADIGQSGGSWRDVWASRVGDDVTWFLAGKTGSGQSRVVQCYEDDNSTECDSVSLELSSSVKSWGTPVAVTGEMAGDELVGSSVALHHGDGDWLLHAELWGTYDGHLTASSEITRDVHRFGLDDDWVCGTGGLLRRFDGTVWEALPLPEPAASMDVRAITEVDGAIVVVGFDDTGAWLVGLGADGDPADVDDWSLVDLGAGREAWDVHHAADGVYVVGRTKGDPPDAFIWFLPL